MILNRKKIEKGKLRLAAQNGDLQKVSDLISSGVEVNNYAEFPGGQTPLIAAIYRKHVEIVKLLLQNGASVREYNEDNFWPIHIAAQEGCEEIVELLLREGDIGVQLQARTKHQTTPLMIASSNGHTTICQTLMNHGPVNEPFDARKQLLVCAVLNGDVQKVANLISSGVEVNNYADFTGGNTPLNSAILGKNEDMVKLLLQNGASVQQHKEDYHWPIHIAVQTGCEEIVKLLLEEGDIAAQLHARTKSYSTPLMIASQKGGHTSICQLLIYYGAEVNAVNDKKFSSLMIAVQRGHVATMELLLRNGADPRAQNMFGETALTFASSQGHLDAVQTLLSLLTTEDLMAEDEEGSTPAFRAAREAKFDIMDLLLKQGGQLLWRSRRSTLLHSLVCSQYDNNLTLKHCHCLKDLIHAKDINGFTPAQLALQTNNVKSFNTLVQYQPELLQTDGLNLIRLALQYAHPEVVDMIQHDNSILHTNKDWLLYLTSNVGKTEERVTILKNHKAMFKRQEKGKEAIANSIKNNHLYIMKILMKWTMNHSELANIWPLWTAIDVGNNDIARYLLKLDSTFQHQVGPDGSLPLQLCLIRDNKRVLAAWRDKCPEILLTFTQSSAEKDFKEMERTEFNSLLDTNDWDQNKYVALCKTYPMFNEQCSRSFKVGQRNKQEFSFWGDVLPHSIDVSACIPTTQYDHKHCAGHLGDKKILACEILSNLVRFIFDIENELNKPGALMELLGPKFNLIGSIPEGTRLGHPDELDMSTMFENIKATFLELNTSDAFGLKLSEDGVEFFTKVQQNRQFQKLKLPVLIMEDRMFNVLAFQQLFLIALEQAIPEVELPNNVQLGTSNSTFDISKCENCVKASKDEGTWIHCLQCFPLLAQTKRGVVLNLIWGNGDVKYKCSIDLVPMYPVPEKDLSILFGSVFHTLTEKKPAGWRGALGKYVRIDRPVHGAFVELRHNSPNEYDRHLLIAMKVLNYGPGSNYIQCPGQSTGLDQFASRRIREAYLFTKGLIKLLNLPVKSYYLKKLFLNTKIIELSRTTRNNSHFILSVLSQPEWGSMFTDCLDMWKMEDRANRVFSQEFKAILK